MPKKSSSIPKKMIITIYAGPTFEGQPELDKLLTFCCGELQKEVEVFADHRTVSFLDIRESYVCSIRQQRRRYMRLGDKADEICILVAPAGGSDWFWVFPDEFLVLKEILWKHDGKIPKTHQRRLGRLGQVRNGIVDEMRMAAFLAAKLDKLVKAK